MAELQSIFSSFPFVPIFLVIVILAYWIHAFFTMYHLVRFGIGVKPKLFALIFFFGSMVLFVSVIFAFNEVDLSSLSFNFKIDWPKPDINFPIPTF